MKIRSSQVVVLVLALVTAIVSIGILRTFRPASGSGADTDAFLQEVQQLREAGKGSSTTAGIVKSKELDISTRPQIEFTVDHIDMGVIARDGKAFQRTPVKNLGSTPLEIGQITTTCGCTMGAFDEYVVRGDGTKVTIIPPGQQKDLIISVDPALVKGFFADKVLTLHSNDPVRPKASLLVKSHVDPEYETEPESGDLDFGKVAQGSLGEVRMLIRQLMDEPFEITGVQLTTASTPANVKPMGKFITMEVVKRPEDQWKTPGKAEWEVIAQISPDAPMGKIFETFQLLTTAPRIPHVDYTLEGSILSFYSVKPQNLGAREPVKPGQKEIATATLLSQFPVEISEVSITGSDLSVSIAPGSQPSETKIQLDAKPEATPGMKNEHVTFRVTAGEQSVVHRMRAFASVEGSTAAEP